MTRYIRLIFVTRFKYNITLMLKSKCPPQFAMLLCFCAASSFAQQPDSFSSAINVYLASNIAPGGNNEVEQDEDDEAEEILYNWHRCLQCHNFSEKELLKQSRPARKKHRRTLKSNTPCYKCHDYAEVVEEICCHKSSVQ